VGEKLLIPFQQYIKSLKQQQQLKGSQVLVAHTYNSSYRGGRDEEDCSLRPSQAKGNEILSQKAKLVMVVHICNPSYMEGRDLENPSLRVAWENKIPPQQISQEWWGICNFSYIGGR
jgi:hypothetical protein